MSTILFKNQTPIRIKVDNLPINLQNLFNADGLIGTDSPHRSPWFDEQERKRKGNKRDFVCNVLAKCIGAADAPFDANVLEAIKEHHIVPPSFEGEIEFEFGPHDTIEKDSINLNLGNGEKRLKWWGELSFGRPNQRHNYIIGIDPSYGLGSANSAAIIIDVNLKEQVGSWVDSNTKPEDFADMILALSYWIGGVDNPFLIWESNAGCGQNFGNRIIYHGYNNVYTQRREDSKTRKQTKKWGWASNEKAKENLLGNLGVALSGGLSGDKDYLSLIIHDEELLKELADCVFRDKGKGIVASSKADLSTGAMERHGDRGIAAGLCVLGMKEQIEGNIKNIRQAPTGSFEFYRKELEKQKEKDRRNNRQFWYD